MAMSGVSQAVPPPLPPPKFIPELSRGRDPGWQWGNDTEQYEFGRSAAAIKPGSSLLGSAATWLSTGHDGARSEKEHEWSACTTNRIRDARRGSSMSTVTDAHDSAMSTAEEQTNNAHPGSASSSRPASSSYRLHGERPLEQRALSDASHSYDKQLLSRIGGPKPPSRGSMSLSTSTHDASPFATRDFEFRPGPVLAPSPLERRPSSFDPLDISRRTSSGAVSPGGASTFWSDSGVPSSRHGSWTTEEPASHRGSYDQTVFVHDELMDESRLHNLHIHDRSPLEIDELQLALRAGTKRRASSPPGQGSRGDRLSFGSSAARTELYHRRSQQQLPHRVSPVSRYHPGHTSISSASSLGPRHGSLGSSIGVSSAPSSATSYGSGRLSPSTYSPGADPEFGIGTPHASTRAVAPSHQRAYSESTRGDGRKLSNSTSSPSHSRHSSLSQLQGIYICECCPKKPKKFDTQEDLRTHESEKQYTCTYCPNRFKNKNEAERHQNSLHLRRHSWSCAALSGVEAAFHKSPNSNHADACGYCGDEFPNPAQWDVRADHLNRVHKFGECNLAKKFFRADHFRQHLKHSHAGTSGKWTNMLENACMKDEPPPKPRTVSSSGGSHQPLGPPALMVTTSGLTGSSALGSSSTQSIPETPHDR